MRKGSVVLQEKAQLLLLKREPAQNSWLQSNFTWLQNRTRIGTFFDNWNENSAYVLGYFAADGCMYHSRNGGFYNGGYYLQFDSTDRELLILVKQLIGAVNKIEKKLLWHGDGFKRKRQYKLRLVSKRSYNRLLQIGFTPAKSLSLTFPLVPVGDLPHFVRGYLDGDGCVYFKRLRRKDSGKYYNLLMVRFTCGSKKFLEVLQKRLSEAVGIHAGSLHRHHAVWDLSYSTRDARQLYSFLYPTSTVPCLARKKLKFEQGLALVKS